MSDPPRRTQIPLPGSSGQTPTGAMQFQQDWPGLFIRGDDAMLLASLIRELEARLADSDDGRISVALYHLAKIAEIIECDVRTQPGESQ